MDLLSQGPGSCLCKAAARSSAREGGLRLTLDALAELKVHGFATAGPHRLPRDASLYGDAVGEGCYAGAAGLAGHVRV